MVMNAGEIELAVGAAAIQHALHTEEPQVYDLLTSTREFLTADSCAAADESAPACAQPGARRDALEITFLGTGAAIPSKYRNVTAVRS